MAYGTVNVPGVSKAELDAVKTIAQKAQQDAGKALEAADAVQELTEEILLAMFGGTLPTETLADNSPEVIQTAAKLGMGANFWSVGDRAPISPNGTVGALTFTGETYYAFIIGFDHNEAIEGKGIHFQFGKTENGTDIAFVDANYNTTGSTPAFRMNLSNTNTGGWESSYMRSTICPAFLAALPEAWRSVIAECTKYSDNTGGGTDNASYVTATTDKVFLLAEYEVFGARTGANSAEQNYQQQYAYYANGNSRIKYRHNAVTSACRWRLRSVNAANTTYFRYVNTGGSGSTNGANNSYGFAPGFKVA